MEIMMQFCEQSMDLAKLGVIKISDEQWRDLARKCGITEEVLKRITNRWPQDGDDAPKFLEKIEDNFYTLGPSHEKALSFLKEQGLKRIKQSQKGKRSALKRME